ncbi:Protein of unknown function [Pyronema omphalodes CBS 100304]|uniref:Uncharacterized protein n=1 Tax=Pyronema omphalodes (strain CBS 100304) TaxID=1076935 RepID=U4LCU1_PYROM|nr:Protein of unknown function [Pyronema omphalodes CBS 100304]
MQAMLTGYKRTAEPVRPAGPLSYFIYIQGPLFLLGRLCVPANRPSTIGPYLTIS